MDKVNDIKSSNAALRLRFWSKKEEKVVDIVETKNALPGHLCYKNKEKGQVLRRLEYIIRTKV